MIEIDLSKLYLSTANIRKYVAQGSGKFYLDNKTQEDAEEFMHALEMALFKELKSFSLFKKTRDKHWGIERIGGGDELKKQAYSPNFKTVKVK